MPDIDVRRNLPADMLWMIGVVITWGHLSLMSRPGYDSHAYWAAWQGNPSTDMYDVAPNFPDAFNYSPVFAQILRPLTLLPWPVFGALWSLLAAAALVYMLRPLGWRWALPLVLCCSWEIISGNIFWLLALTAVVGLRPRPAAAAVWAVPLLTKVSPAVGPIWFAVRRQWRHLAASVATTAVVVGISWLITPDLWVAWLDFLVSHEASGQAVGSPIAPPLAYRLPLALVVVVYAALTDRRWLVPVAMVLATPVAGAAALVMLAAIPRLRVIEAPTVGPGVVSPSHRPRTLHR